MGDCPHPQEAAKNHSLRGNKATPRRSWAPAHTRKKRQKITRFVTTRPLRVVRGRLPTPARSGKKSLASWQQGHSASFVGSRPHPQEAAKNHSLRDNKATPRRSWATAHTRKKRQKITRFVATRPLRVVRGLPPTPARITRSLMLARSWATAHTRRKRQRVTRSLMLACSWATAHTRRRRQRVTRSQMLACSWASAHTRRRRQRVRRSQMLACSWATAHTRRRR